MPHLAKAEIEPKRECKRVASHICSIRLPVVFNSFVVDFFMRGRMGGESGGQLVVSLLVWIVMLAASGVLLMVLNANRRFSVRWLFVFTTIVAFLFGSLVLLFHFIQNAG